MEILKDIPSETGQQMFTTLRYYNDNTEGLTMISDVDEYILSGTNLASSHQPSLKCGDVVEIQGAAASGKTQLLYHIAAKCILPYEVVVTSSDTRSECRAFLGGWQKSAVIFDCDNHWDIRRLHDILISRVNGALSPLSLPSKKLDVDAATISLKCLSRLHLFRPTSSVQLAATLLNLPRYHEEQMPLEEIRLLVVDSISSFYWMDRWQVESSGPYKGPRPNPLRSVLQSLQAFRLSHGPVTILANWGLKPLTPVASSTSSSSLAPFFKQHLPSPFPTFSGDLHRRSLPADLPLTFQITLSLPTTPQMRSNLRETQSAGLEEAPLEERGRDVAEGVEITAYVRKYHPENIVQNGYGRFKLRVLEHDVVATQTAI